MSAGPPTPPPGAMPLPPFSELGAAAVSLHELYRIYVEAGFTEPQAFEITMIVFRSAFGRS